MPRTNIFSGAPLRRINFKLGYVSKEPWQLQVVADAALHHRAMPKQVTPPPHSPPPNRTTRKLKAHVIHASSLRIGHYHSIRGSYPWCLLAPYRISTQAVSSLTRPKHISSPLPPLEPLTTHFPPPFPNLTSCQPPPHNPVHTPAATQR